VQRCLPDKIARYNVAANPENDDDEDDADEDVDVEDFG
jgi:hypothetical protein